MYPIYNQCEHSKKAILLSDTWKRIASFAHTCKWTNDRKQLHIEINNMDISHPNVKGYFQLVMKCAANHSARLMGILKKGRAIVRFFHRSISTEKKLKAHQILYYPHRTSLKLIGDMNLLGIVIGDGILSAIWCIAYWRVTSLEYSFTGTANAWYNKQSRVVYHRRICNALKAFEEEAPCDFPLCSKMMPKIRWRRFNNVEKVQEVSQRVLDDVTRNDFQKSFKTSHYHWK